MKANLIIWLGSGLSALLLFLSLKNGKKSQSHQTVNRVSQLFQMFKKLGCSDSFARLLIAQSAHETNGWASEVFRQNNNLFGMKMPRTRKTTAIVNKGGYAYYNSVEDSAQDMMLWLTFERYDYTLETLENLTIMQPNRSTIIDNYIFMYTEFLKDNGYFTDTLANYYNGVKFWYHKLISK